jgi:hypothetical protein
MKFTCPNCGAMGNSSADILRDARNQGFITACPAVAQIAASYREWVDLFEKANKGLRSAVTVPPEDQR